MKRIAFFGPLSPTASGISDYDEELLPHLRKHYDIDVFVDQEKPCGESVYPHHDFYFRHKARPYDFIIYQMGNSMFHEYMYCYLFEFPGAIVFHDYAIHQSRATMLLRRLRTSDYEEEIRIAHPDAPNLAGTLMNGTFSSLLFSYFPMVRLPLLAALSAGAHSEIVAEKLRITGGPPVVKIPMAVVSESEKFSKDPFPGKFVIASFGLATSAKRIIEVLPAISRLQREYKNILYVIVGEIDPQLHLKEFIRRWQLEDSVHITGRKDKDDFLRHIARADVVINLRYPSSGETSATMLRAMSAAKPVFITRLNYLREIPDGAAVRIRTVHEAEDTYHALKHLIDHPEESKKLGKAARRFIETDHRFDQMVDAYLRLIELGFKRKETFRKRQLPLHLCSAKEILSDYIRRTSLKDLSDSLINEIAL